MSQPAGIDNGDFPEQGVSYIRDRVQDALSHSEDGHRDLAEEKIDEAKTTLRKKLEPGYRNESWFLRIEEAVNELDATNPAAIERAKNGLDTVIAENTWDPSASDEEILDLVRGGESPRDSRHGDPDDPESWRLYVASRAQTARNALRDTEEGRGSWQLEEPIRATKAVLGAATDLAEYADSSNGNLPDDLDVDRIMDAAKEAHSFVRSGMLSVAQDHLQRIEREADPDIDTGSGEDVVDVGGQKVVCASPGSAGDVEDWLDKYLGDNVVESLAMAEGGGMVTACAVLREAADE